MLAAALVGAWLAAGVGAQEPTITVADGIYTEAQASRGAAAYEAACAGCHRADLSGNSGPALKEQRFARVYAGKDLRTLYSKIADTMPRNTPGSLTADVYLDIVAHVLKENGFKPGARELTADALDAIRVVPGQAKAAPPVGDFSYVEVVGCLTAGPDGTWMLTHASEPTAAVPSAPVSSAETGTRPGTLGGRRRCSCRDRGSRLHRRVGTTYSRPSWGRSARRLGRVVSGPAAEAYPPCDDAGMSGRSRAS